MPQGIHMQASQIDCHTQTSSFAFAPSVSTDQPSDPESHVRLYSSLLNRIPVGLSAIHEMQALIHHGIGAFVAGFQDRFGARIVSMEHMREERAGDFLTIGALQGTGHIRHCFPRGDALKDARPAALLVDLLLDEAFDRLCSHAPTYCLLLGDASLLHRADPLE